MSRSAKTPKYNEFNTHPLCFGRFQETTASLQATLDGSKLMIEVGAGEAHVSLAFARQNPDWQIIAIDRKSDRLLQAARIAADEGLKNVYFLQADLTFMDELVDLTELVDIVWLTFPDPYFKDRQQKHRLTDPKQRAIFNKYLKKQGQLRFKTDNVDLFAFTIDSLNEGTDYDIVEKTHDLHSEPGKYDPEVYEITKYERIFLSEGLKTNYLKAIIKN